MNKLEAGVQEYMAEQGQRDKGQEEAHSSGEQEKEAEGLSFRRRSGGCSLKSRWSFFAWDCISPFRWSYWTFYSGPINFNLYVNHKLSAWLQTLELYKLLMLSNCFPASLFLMDCLRNFPWASVSSWYNHKVGFRILFTRPQTTEWVWANFCLKVICKFCLLVFKRLSMIRHLFALMKFINFAYLSSSDWAGIDTSLP